MAVGRRAVNSSVYRSHSGDLTYWIEKENIAAPQRLVPAARPWKPLKAYHLLASSELGLNKYVSVESALMPVEFAGVSGPLITMPQASPCRSSSSRSSINQTMPESNLPRISPERRTGGWVITAAFLLCRLHMSSHEFQLFLGGHVEVLLSVRQRCCRLYNTELCSSVGRNVREAERIYTRCRIVQNSGSLRFEAGVW